MRPSRTSERTSGVEREPGDVQAPATPQRTSSSTKARSRTYVSAVSVKMSCRMAETVVLLHGFAGTRHAWDLVADRLDPERYRPLALDLRGHGDARDARPVAFDGVVSDVAAQAPDRFVLCGYSLGGRVALHVALAHPERVSRLVLLASTPRLRPPGLGQAPRAAR